MLIEATAVSKIYTTRAGLFSPLRPLAAVKDVSVSVADGEVVALVGESGSGKSTLGRILLGLIPATAGSVNFDDKPITGLSGAGWRAYRRGAQAVFQDTSASLNPRRTVGESVAAPFIFNMGLSSGEARAGAMKALERVGLPAAQYFTRYPHQLSGGQRQRVGLARALASQPRFLVADEPVSALDVSIRAQMLKLLIDLQREEGLACLFITHDLAAARAVASRALVMRLGEVVEAGPIAQVFERPMHPYTQALVAAASEGAARITGARIADARIADAQRSDR